MKIHQLPQGARFSYDGKEYAKTGPMSASAEGGQRLIPRYAVLHPVGALVSGDAKTESAYVPRAKLLGAFAVFHAQCQALLTQDRQADLDLACDRFLKSLD